MLKPQGFGQSEAHSCALGAAMDALGGSLHSSGADTPDLVKHFPDMYAMSANCPECGRFHHYMTGCIALCLNDKHRWTREQIADWVATIEDQQREAEREALHQRVLAGGVPI